MPQSEKNKKQNKTKTHPSKIKPNPKTRNPTRMCTVEKRGRIFILTLTGDDEHRLSPTLIAEIRSALARIRSDSLSSPYSTALVTRGVGRFFSNGFDLKYSSSAPTSAARAARLNSMVASFAPLVADLISLPMPTIAAVTGHAAAAGLLLAIAHDYVGMRADRGVLYMSEMDMKLPFPKYFLATMREKIKDLRIFKDIAMKARKIGAREALERGMIDFVKDTAEETVEAALKMAEEFVGRNWDGKVYASIRRASFPIICRAVGLEEESEEERTSLFASKL